MKNKKVLNIFILVLVCEIIYLLYQPVNIDKSNTYDLKLSNHSSNNYSISKNESNKTLNSEEINITATIKKESVENTIVDNSSKNKTINNIVEKDYENINIKKEQYDNIVLKEESEIDSNNEKKNNIYDILDCYEFDTGTGTIKNYKDSSSCPKNIIIPEKINNVKVITIGAYAFSNKGLISVELPKGITEIESYAFYGNNLKQIVIPYGTNIVGSYAFAKNNLTTVVSKEPEHRISISKNAFLPFKYDDIKWPNVASIPPSPIKLVEK